MVPIALGVKHLQGLRAKVNKLLNGGHVMACPSTIACSNAACAKAACIRTRNSNGANRRCGGNSFYRYARRKTGRQRQIHYAPNA